MKLHIGDIIVINGAEHVVMQKVWHWGCGMQCRIAPLNRIDYCGVVISASGHLRPVRRDLGAAALAMNCLAWEYHRSARRSRLPRTKQIWKSLASKWERRRERVRRLELASGWHTIDVTAELSAARGGGA